LNLNIGFFDALIGNLRALHLLAFASMLIASLVSCEN